MGALKAGEVERYLNRPNLEVALHLIYGPDRGLVNERAVKLSKATQIDLSDPFTAIRIDATELSSDPDRLMNEAYTVSMFGSDRLIWLRGAGNDASLVKQIERLLSDPPQSTHCIVEAGDLKKGAKLRDLVERAKNGLAIPCYADGARDIAGLLDQVLAENKLGIGLDARQLLLSQLGADRLASRGEIEKLCLYAQGNSTIAIEDVQAIIGDASALSFDAITDAVITGDTKGFDGALAKFTSSGGSTHQLFATVLRQFQALDKMRWQMEAQGKNASAAVNGAKPPVFFARKRAVETALNTWSSKAIRAAHDRLQTAMLESRKNNTVGNEIAYMTLLGLTIQAARQRR